MAYFDNNATAPLKRPAYERMVEVLQHTGNASAVHTNGRAMRKYIEDARVEVASLVGCEPENVIFTSGGTEAIVTAMSPFHGRTMVISSIEHSSVLANAPKSPQIPVTREGVFDLEAAERLIKEHKPEMVSVIMANNETGVIQPAKDIVDLAHKYGALVHLDGIQALGKTKFDWADIGADYMSVAAHKIGGPQGAGALIKSKSAPFTKLMHGGTQEKHMRGGTENVAAIAGFGAAAAQTILDMDKLEAIRAMRDGIEEHILASTNQVTIWGRGAARVPNTIMLSLAGVPSQTQVMILDLCGVSVGSGSACSSGTLKPSRVLLAMGASEDEAQSCLRISVGWSNTEEDAEKLKSAWTEMIGRIRHKMQAPC